MRHFPTLFIATISVYFIGALSDPANAQSRTIEPGYSGDVPTLIRTDISAASSDFASLPDATRQFLQSRPGAYAATMDARISAFYGSPLLVGGSAEAVEEAFWEAAGEAFGTGPIDLIPIRSHVLRGGRLSVFAYQQRVAGVPVEYSSARLLIHRVEKRSAGDSAVKSHDRNRRNALSAEPDSQTGQTEYRATYAAGKFVVEPPGGFPQISVRPEEVAGIVTAHGEYADLTKWSAPELVVYAGDEPEWGDGPNKFGDAVRAWKTVGERGDEMSGPPRVFTFFVDAAGGGVVGMRSEVHHFDVEGQVRANATLIVPSQEPDEWWNWARPDNGSNYGLFPMPELRVSIENSASQTFSESDGTFLIPHSDTENIQLRAVINGRWFDVDFGTVPPEPNEESDDYALLTSPGSPTQDWDLIMNPAPTQNTTIQMNAFVYASLTRNLFVSRSAWTGLNQVLRIVPNEYDPCNAVFSTLGSLSFGPGHSGAPYGDCGNFTYSSVIAHEYGHFVVHRLGLAQGSFGEGFSDCCALLVTDDPVVSRGPVDDPPQAASRNYSPGQTEVTYPCPVADGQLCDGNEVYCCGSVLAGLWWDVREHFHAGAGQPGDPFADDAEALEYARQLFVDWSLMTQGRAGNEAAHTLTGLEMFLVDEPRVRGGVRDEQACKACFGTYEG